MLGNAYACSSAPHCGQARTQGAAQGRDLTPSWLVYFPKDWGIVSLRPLRITERFDEELSLLRKKQLCDRHDQRFRHAHAAGKSAGSAKPARTARRSRPSKKRLSFDQSRQKFRNAARIVERDEPGGTARPTAEQLRRAAEGRDDNPPKPPAPRRKDRDRDREPE
jgi:hypothetical protein